MTILDPAMLKIQTIHLIRWIQGSAYLGAHDCEAVIRRAVRDIDRQFANARGQR